MNVEETPKNSWISFPIIDQIKKFEKKRANSDFLNRRGYAPIQFCTACKVSLECKNCSTKLVYHKTKNVTCAIYVDTKFQKKRSVLSVIPLIILYLSVQELKE